MHQFGRLVKVFKLLSPYAKAAIQQYLKDGVPLQRSLFYHFPDDIRSWDIEHQYMYGDDLMVAPVLEV